MSRPQASKARLAARRQPGFSLFEFLVCTVIISVLVAVLLNRLGYYQEMAEKAAMESTLRIIKTGLQIELAALIVTNRQAEAARLESEDPVQWLDDKPPNYAGRYRAPPDAATWYFDPGEHQLVYVVNSGNRLDVDNGEGVKQIRFRARLLKDRLMLNGNLVERTTGVTLAPVRPYRWR